MKNKPILHSSLELLVLWLALTVGCAPITSAPSVPVTAFQVTATNVPAEAIQTGTAAPTETVTPTAGPASLAPSATRSPATGAVTAPPGVYVTKIRLDPPAPKSGPDYVTFYATFQNTTGKMQQYKWLVKIYTADDSSHSFGETAALVSNIPPGTTELASAANWRTNPLSCLPLTARVFFVNPDLGADPFEFKKPDGSAGVATNFQVCPAPPSS